MDEQEIIALLRARDERGVEQLLRQYGPLLRYVIAPILPDGQDREECLSSCAMRVWERIESFSPERGSFRAWLTAIARNAALNMTRRARPDAEALPPNTVSDAPTPEEALLRRERSAALLAALAELPLRERTLFYRKYYYQQSTAQIAAELGLSERAVEGRLYRLKKRLRKALGGDVDAG